ncbi:MAG: N(5)-(carboxyethyl)ornithine synthase [Deltaproteobacteria bacterium]|nr:N(5)-(carboxyethyl)ornithine synthase [Deltaproteobacteria bacterium]
MLKLGVVGTSRKENEKRVSIHPDHLCRIPEDLRQHIAFEEGYGEPFGMTDAKLVAQCGGLAGRKELLEHSDIVLLTKPMIEDFEEIQENGILWGWPHCVQQRNFVQAAIDRKLTLIAFEEMFVWGPDEHRGRHTFYKNNEFAGYCAVLHALRLKGIDGHYGKQRKIVILSFGAVSRGAIYALKARGFIDITICIQRPDHLVREEVLGCYYLRMRCGEEGEPRMVAVEHDGTEFSLFDLIRDADILINGTFQDTDMPITFVNEEETSRLKSGSLIVDISCDEGLGFPFAKPTTFSNPTFKVGQVDYYAVDHTPSYLWESASWEISAALLKYLPVVMGGPDSWKKDETIRRAIEIRDGVVQNPKILSFQKRSPEYPHDAVT